MIGAFIRDSNGHDYDVELISESEYNSISEKTTSSRPSSLWFYPSYPLAYIYLYPTPDAAETLWLVSMKIFTETSSFDSLTATLAFPPEYEEPLINNLALRLAPRFGKTTPAEITSLANSGLETISVSNLTNNITPTRLSFPCGSSGTAYDIDEG
jgi:hypothetical protein